MVNDTIRVLALYRGKLAENRGTPIRVRTILAFLLKDSRFSLTVASWDEVPPFPDIPHIHLTNRKLYDLKKLSAATRNVDVVLGHTMSSWYYLAFLKLFVGKPIVLEMHGFLEEEARLYGDIDVVSYYISKFVYGFFYRLCGAITTCGGLGTDILSRYNKNVRPMIGGVDTSVFNPNVSPGGFIKRKESTVIGYAGNARKWQGLPFLAEVFFELYRRDSSFTLAILSSEKKGVPEGEGIQIISSMPYEHVPKFLADCDILVIPRPYDRVSRLGPPSKLLEYMAMGKAVVVSEVGYMNHIVTDGFDGRTYPPNDKEALKRIFYELKDRSIRKKLGENAHETVRRGYTWEKEVHTLTDRLTEVTRK